MPPYGTGLSAVAHQTDGKVVALGARGALAGSIDLVLVRLTVSGELDAAFGVGGIATASVGGVDFAHDLILLPSGSILVLGEAEGVGVYLARFDRDGSLDPGFGTAGVLLISPAPPIRFLYPSAVSVQSDGRILVVGNDYSQATILVLRYLQNGTPDASFGQAGTLILPASARGIVGDLLVQPDDKIVIAGVNGSRFFAFRLNPDGTLDPTFGAGGTSFVGFPATQIRPPARVLLQPGGEIVLEAGIASTNNDPDPDVALVRLDTRGVLDPSFGQGGLARRGFPDPTHALSTVLQVGNRLLVVGTMLRESSTDVFLGAFTKDGQLDKTYGPPGGAVSAPFHSSPTWAFSRAASVSPDGRVVVVGTAFEDTGSQDFMLVRADPPCAPGFEMTSTPSACPQGEGTAIVTGPPDLSTFSWTVRNGVILSGHGTSRIRYRVGNAGMASIQVVASGSEGSETAFCEMQGTASMFIDAAGCTGALGYYTVSPCRAVDTRPSGPDLPAGRSRRFPIAGTCGVPEDARAVTANVTVLSASTAGSLRVSAEGIPAPPTTVTSFRAGDSRATATQITLGEMGAIRVESTQPSGTCEVIIDISGYYR